MKPPLSVLDLVPLADGMSSTQALAQSLDLARLAERVEQYAATLPSADQVRDELIARGFTGVEVSAWEFTLDYGSSSELFADPVIQHAALSDWRWCAEAAPEPDAALAALRQCFDTYFAGGRFGVTVVGGVASAFKAG